MSGKAIDGLNPANVWEYFYGISQVPRPSKKEGKIIEHVKKFALDNNFELKQDETGNMIIKVPATPGYENKPVVILQAHLDMVCEKNKGNSHDFDNDPIELVKDGDWIKANGTTLGADNGIGVAGAMAAATDPDMVHGPLELLMTIDEETGLTGANNLDGSMLSGDILINMDSEVDGIFYIGCSGGQDTVGVLEKQTGELKEGMIPYELQIGGLKGGHSGLDIHQGRANAIRFLGQLLHKMEKFYFKIAEINGGSKRNAIPREAEALLMIDPEDEKEIRLIIDEFYREAMLEYKTNDGGLEISFEKSDKKVNSIYRGKFARTLIDVILALPHGIMAMSPDIEDLVETSTNLATIQDEGDTIRIGTSQRSSIESAKMNISDMVASVFELADAEVIIGDGYPGWQPDINSPLLKMSLGIYEEMFNKKADIKAIHAGLECGILADKKPGLDMISFGPTIENAHSPDERVNIKDVEKFYELLRGILKKLAE